MKDTTTGIINGEAVSLQSQPVAPARSGVLVGPQDQKRGWRRSLRSSREAVAHRPEIPALIPAGNRRWHYLTVKRVSDLVGAALLMILLAPVILVTLLVLTVTTKGRPFFAQERIGHCGRPFWMYKFRTMVRGAAKMQHLVSNEKDGPIFKNSDDPRVTRLGRFLRSFSIDETPQLINVLQGHMSLVGPRPPVIDEVIKYESWQRIRLCVKPGLTCLWQVSGRSDIGFEQWMKMDVWYVENQSLWTDSKLLLKTPVSVLSTRGAY